MEDWAGGKGVGDIHGLEGVTERDDGIRERIIGEEEHYVTVLLQSLYRPV